MRKVQPWFAALANAVFPGIGYIILQKRLVFGWMLLVATITGTIWQFLPSVQQSWSTDPFANVLTMVGFMFATAAFAYDAYTLAKE